MKKVYIDKVLKINIYIDSKNFLNFSTLKNLK